MAVYFSNKMHYNNAICWDNLYKKNATRIVSVSLKPYSVKMHFNMVSNRSAGNINIFDSSETTRVASFEFYNWLAGLIDGDGLFIRSKKGYWSCEITLKVPEYSALTKIKYFFGGTIKKRTNVQAIRWRLTNKKGLVLLAHALNGRLLSPIRRNKLLNLLLDFNIPSYTFSNEQIFLNIKQGWLTGFFEAKGCFLYNSKTKQLAIRIAQKNKDVLELIIECFKVGNLFFDKSWNGFILNVSSQEDLNVFLIIFKNYPFLSGSKQFELKQFNRLLLFKSRKYHLLPLDSRKRKRYENLVKKFLTRGNLSKEEDIVH